MCGQPMHCACLCIGHGWWVLGVGGWAKGWGGGLARCLAGYIPSTYLVFQYTGIYLVYTHPPNLHTGYMAHHSWLSACQPRCLHILRLVTVCRLSAGCLRAVCSCLLFKSAVCGCCPMLSASCQLLSAYQPSAAVCAVRQPSDIKHTDRCVCLVHPRLG